MVAMVRRGGGEGKASRNKQPTTGWALIESSSPRTAPPRKLDAYVARLHPACLSRWLRLARVTLIFTSSRWGAASDLCVLNSSGRDLGTLTLASRLVCTRRDQGGVHYTAAAIIGIRSPQHCLPSTVSPALLQGPAGCTVAAHVGGRPNVVHFRDIAPNLEVTRQCRPHIFEQSRRVRTLQHKPWTLSSLTSPSLSLIDRILSWTITP